MSHGERSDRSAPSPAGRWRRRFGRLILLLAAVAGSLAAGEAFVRWRYPEYGIPVFTTKLFTEYDPLLGWRKIPNFHGTHVQEEYTIVERFNSKGLRGPEYPYEKPAGEYRILVLGDSFAEGYTVEFDDLCSEILKRSLKDATGRRIEVINAGTGGYGSDQELLFFREEGRKYHPDFVVVLYCENDAPMNVKSNYYAKGRGQKPLFALTNGTLTLRSTPQKTWDRDAEAGKDLAQNRHDYKQPFVLWKPDTWYLHRLVKHVLSRRGAQVAAGAPVDLAAGTQTATLPTSGVYRGRQEDWTMTEALLGQLKREAGEAGAQFVLFNIPEKGEVYSPKPGPAAIEQNLRVLAQRQELRFIPTVDLFRRRAAEIQPSGTRLYWKKDSHWTAAGHRLTAEILTQYLLQHREEVGL